MEILRLSSIEEIQVPFVIPSGYSDTTINVLVTDLADLTTTSTEYTNVSSGQTIQIILSGEYDNDYKVDIFESEINYIHSEVYNVVRPYVNPSDLSETGTASEIQEYKVFEMVARSIIDTFVDYGFYNKKQILQTTGQGGDYISVWNKINKILKVYENNVLVYDTDPEFENLEVYTITQDKTAIQRFEVDTINRSEGALRYLLASGGDIWQDTGRMVAFPSGYDYTIIFDGGYKSIPDDVVYAAKLLIEDIKCGKLEYYKRYTTSYSTDQYKIQFDKSMIDGTGNLIVDKILEKYMLSIKRPGII